MSSSYDFSKRKISAPNQNNDKQETSSQQSSFTDKRESTDEITQLSINNIELWDIFLFTLFFLKNI